VSLGTAIDNARARVEEAIRVALEKPSRDGRDMARDAEAVHHLASALRHLERARQVLVEYAT